MKKRSAIGSCLIGLIAFADMVPQCPFPESKSTTYSQDNRRLRIGFSSIGQRLDMQYLKTANTSSGASMSWP